MLEPQGYAIVEYTLPSGAARGKAAVDMIENEMRPDAKKAKARLLRVTWIWLLCFIPLQIKIRVI